MHSVLLLAYHFPPENGSCPDKNVRILKSLLLSGHNVKVLTVDATAPTAFHWRGYCARVYRTNKGIFHQEKNGNTVEKASLETSRLHSLKKAVSLALIPDGAIDWIGAAKRYIAHNADVIEGVDVILSTSSPYSSHILARSIAERYSLPYILCYGDPWVYEPKRQRGALRYAIEKSLEGNLVGGAARVLLITDYNKNRYLELYGVQPDSINTYSIGCDPIEPSSVGAHSEPVMPQLPKSLYRIVYGGSLDPVHRNPLPTIEAIRDIPDVSLTIYNNDRPDLTQLVTDLGASERITVRLQVPSHEFARLILDYDALLLFGNKTQFQVPGKLYTYIATGKHIIYVKNNSFEDDGAEKVLRDYGNCTIVSNVATKIAPALIKLTHMPVRTLRASDINKFSFPVTMAPIVSAVDNAIKTR